MNSHEILYSHAFLHVESVANVSFLKFTKKFLNYCIAEYEKHIAMHNSWANHPILVKFCSAIDILTTNQSLTSVWQDSHGFTELQSRGRKSHSFDIILYFFMPRWPNLQRNGPLVDTFGSSLPTHHKNCIKKFIHLRPFRVMEVSGPNHYFS